MKRRAAAWLVLLGPFFYLSYGLANHLAASRADVPSLVFDWERHLPFWAWTIFPYWSLNLFYGLSLGSILLLAALGDSDGRGPADAARGTRDDDVAAHQRAARVVPAGSVGVQVLGPVTPEFRCVRGEFGQDDAGAL